VFEILFEIFFSRANIDFTRKLPRIALICSVKLAGVVELFCSKHDSCVFLRHDSESDCDAWMFFEAQKVRFQDFETHELSLLMLIAFISFSSQILLTREDISAVLLLETSDFAQQIVSGIALTRISSSYQSFGVVRIMECCEHPVPSGNV
jgi:hypothetical protein